MNGKIKSNDRIDNSNNSNENNNEKSNNNGNNNNNDGKQNNVFVLLMGTRGSGKSLILEKSLESLDQFDQCRQFRRRQSHQQTIIHCRENQSSHQPPPFRVVRLNGVLMAGHEIVRTVHEIVSQLSDPDACMGQLLSARENHNGDHNNDNDDDDDCVRGTLLSPEMLNAVSTGKMDVNDNKDDGYKLCDTIGSKLFDSSDGDDDDDEQQRNRKRSLDYERFLLRPRNISLLSPESFDPHVLTIYQS